MPDSDHLDSATEAAASSRSAAVTDVLQEVLSESKPEVGKLFASALNLFAGPGAAETDPQQKKAALQRALEKLVES